MYCVKQYFGVFCLLGIRVQISTNIDFAAYYFVIFGIMSVNGQCFERLIMCDILCSEFVIRSFYGHAM